MSGKSNNFEKERKIRNSKKPLKAEKVRRASKLQRL